MSSTPLKHYYWDACVFLAYVKEEPGRAEVIESWLQDAANGRIRIYTSAISIPEVLYGANAATGRFLSKEDEEKIDTLWSMTSIVIVDASINLMYDTRRLRREAHQHGFKLRSPDALHVATALYVNNLYRIIEIHSYDSDIKKCGLSTCASLVNGMTICEPPPTGQPALPFGSS